MSSLAKDPQSQSADSPDKSKFGFYLCNAVYLLTTLAVLGFLYQSVSTFFLGN